MIFGLHKHLRFEIQSGGSCTDFSVPASQVNGVVALHPVFEIPVVLVDPKRQFSAGSFRHHVHRHVVLVVAHCNCMGKEMSAMQLSSVLFFMVTSN